MLPQLQICDSLNYCVSRILEYTLFEYSLVTSIAIPGHNYGVPCHKPTTQLQKYS